jgi:hypothetical protein
MSHLAASGRPVREPSSRQIAAAPRGAPHPGAVAAASSSAARAHARAALLEAAVRPPPRPWEPARPASVRLVPAGYRPPAYRTSAYHPSAYHPSAYRAPTVAAPPRPMSGGSMLGMAHTYVAGPLAPPAPVPMPARTFLQPGGG